MLPLHVQRMQTEFKELEIKQKALETFINSSPVFESLADIEKRDLELQSAIMEDYLSVLGRRLQRAINAEEQDGDQQ